MGLALVVIASEHNVAEAQAVLALRPQLVVVIASSHRAILARARRLAEWIGHEAPSCQTRVVAASTKGDDYWETTRALKEELVPALQQLQQANPAGEIVLNITGGTKATVVAALEAWSWTDVVYTAISRGGLQSTKRDGPYPPLPTLNPTQHLRLYTALSLTESAPSLPDPIWRTAASALWLATHQEGSPWSRLGSHSVFQRFTAGHNDEAPAGSFKLAWEDVAGLQAWWSESLGSVLPIDDPAQLVLPAGTASLSKSQAKSVKRANRWLRGGWLEDVTVQWLLDMGIAPSAIVAGVSIRPLKDEAPVGDTSNEIDVLVAHKGRLWVLECKHTIGRDKVQDNANQLGNLLERCGKPNGALVVSTRPPDALFRITAARQLQVIDSPESLRDWLFPPPAVPAISATGLSDSAPGASLSGGGAGA